MHLSGLVLVFSLLTGSLAGRIGRFTFLQQELLQEGETLEDKANQTELLERAERGFIARLDYLNDTLLQTHSPAESESKVSALLAQFQSNNATQPLNGSFYLQLRVKQKETERLLNDTSDYYFARDGGEALLQKHATADDCVDSVVYGEALEFEISKYAYDRNVVDGAKELLEAECHDHSYKKRNSYSRGDRPNITVEATTRENCFDNNAFAQEHFRYASASFTPVPTQVVLENVTESSCFPSADKRIVSFVPYNESIVFHEEFVREEECLDSADAVSPFYAYNTENRWDTDRRSDASKIENATVVSLTSDQQSRVPYYVNKDIVSTGTLQQFNSPSFSNPAVITTMDEQPFSRHHSMEKQWPSREPAFTLMAWVKGHGTLLSILSSTSVCGKQAVFSIDAMGKPMLDFACLDQHDSRLHTVTSEWRHVAFTYDGHGTRTIVTDGEEEVDVYHNTSRDYFKETGKVFVNPHTHNTVLTMENELGDPFGRFAGFSERDCLEASLAMNHPYFALEEGVCNSSASVSTGSAAVFHRSVQYRIQQDDFLRMELGPFVGEVDELLFFAERLPKERIHQLGLTQNTGTRFNASSLIAHPMFGRGASKKISWEQYPNFYEEQIERTECHALGDARYETPLNNHPTYKYSAEGRGGSSVLSYKAYSKGLENITHLAGGTYHCQDDLLLDTGVMLHSYQNNTSMNECRAQRSKDGVCLLNGEAVESSESDCTGVFLPFTNYTWLPDPYTIEYDTKESDCPQSSEYWGYSEPLLLGAQGRNTQVYNDHERDFYWLNKVGGPRETVNMSSLASVQEWCRATISCAGIQQDGDHYYPVEEITGPSEDYGYRICLDEKAHRVGALQCFVEAAKELQEGVLYIHGDEFRLHPWGYSGSANGTSCTKNNNSFFWGDGTYGDEVCSDKAQDYYALPIVQTRWQRDNDTILSTKEKDCVAQRLQWLPHAREYDTRGTATRPHFLVSDEKTWQREPVDCLYASEATFAINKTTVRECRDEAIFFGAIGYSFQGVGAEFIHMTARHYTHPEEARAECQRLQAHSDGPENAWDLCTNDEWDCASDNSCLTSDTPDNTIFAVAACCFNTGTSCAITTNTSVCTPKRGYESFFFGPCADEEVENATNTTYNVYAPEWNRSEWRAETHSRAYDAAYYDIVQESEPCDRGMHLSYEECQTIRGTTFSSKVWLGEVYDKNKIAGCAVEGNQMYYNRYLYDSAKRPNASDVAVCKRIFEHFSSTFDYDNTACMYLNHELELSVNSQSACQDYGSAHGFKAISYSDQRCLLARARGPCEAKTLWSSSFFVEAEVEGHFTRNANLETSIISISECLLNRTALFDFKQVPYGREEHGLQYSPQGQSHADLETAKLACDSNVNCTIVYATPAGVFYALNEAMAHELLPTHAQYTLHRHWVKNTENYQNRTHARHFHATSKEACHEACLADTSCMQVVFTEGYCFFYDDVYEVSDSGALDSHTLHLELKGAVAYGDTGDCWLYRNSIGRGKCTDFTNASNYSVYPLDESLTGENKVVYVREEADTLQASAYAPIVTEERTEEWCQNREGSSVWQKYADVVYKSTTEECTEGTWVKDTDLTRSMVLQRECELLDSHAAFTRNPNIVTETNNGGLSYQKQYDNGYKKLLGLGCGSEGEGIEYEYESGTLYGQECYSTIQTNSTCQSKDKGHGYALYGGLCLVYDYPINSNVSDCRYKHAMPNNQSSGTYRPVSHLNLAEAIDACNARSECVGVCEGEKAYYISSNRGTEASYQCHRGWSGDSCATVEAKPYANERITDKRHTAIAYCQMLGKELCKAEHVPLGYDCVHYKEQSNCTVVDHTNIHPVAFCCGKEVYSGKAQKQAIFYNRTTALGTCQDAPIELLGSAVFDDRAKLLDSYTVDKVAKALCHGGSQANTDNCEQSCLNSSSCLFFTNRSTETDCWLHTECTSLIAFGGNFSTYRLRRKQGVYDAPQAQHAMLGDCQYHYGVQALVEEELEYAEATQTLHQRWRCERASISMLRNLTYSIHSFNESFQFDIMEEHTVEDERRIHEHLKALNYSSTSVDSLEACLAQAQMDQVVSFNEATKECLLFADSWEAIKRVSQYTGASRESYGLYEGPFYTTVYEATPIASYVPSVTVSSWLESTAKDDCEVLCKANEQCEAYALAGQECQLHAMPNQTMVDYLRTVKGTGSSGSILLFLRTSGEYVCRRGAVAWNLVLVPSDTQHPLGNTEALSTSASLGACKQAFLNDERVPRLDTVLYNASTGECRISLLRNRLLEASNISANGFLHYTLSKQNPYRTEATKYETEDIARDTCMTYDSLLVGRDSTSWASAVLWEREQDVIRHEMLEEHCGVALPPQPPLLSYAWDQNQQGSLAFNIKEAECKQSPLFLSWRTNIAGQKKIEVQNETECLSYSTNETSALYLGREPIKGADYRSSCNGIVAEHNFERLFTEPLRMLASEDKRITVSEPSIDACAATALEYYSHFNRSASSKVFEYHFTKTGLNCAYFESEECLGLCLVEDSPSAARVGFSSFRLDDSLGIGAAACWLLSVTDSTEGNAYCRKCPIGKHNSRAASNCLPCQQGRYSDEEGLKACKSCKEGTFQFGSGETHCNMCAAGQYQDEIGERGCKICAAGKYEEAGVCKDCPVGKAGPSNFLENKAGELQYTGSSYKGALVYFDPRYDYSGVHGISYKDEQGVYMKGYSPIFTSLRSRQAALHDSPDDCLSCEAGKYGDIEGLEECKACAHGTYTDQSSQSLCESCNQGRVARATEANNFHAFMPYACSSAEMLGEYRKYNTTTNAYDKTGEDIGLLREEAQPHLEDCFQSCKAETECLFVSYKASTCRLHRKCDERGEAGWTAYRLSRSVSSVSESASSVLSIEATVYGPPHHECEEESILLTPETYQLEANRGITTGGTIGTALNFQEAINQCNSRRDCVGFTYAGAEEVSLRTFEENAPILLKNQGDTFEQNGLQSWFKEKPVNTKSECQERCAQLPECNYMEWNGTKACRKWSSCTPVKKATLTAPESSLYRIALATSFSVFPFQGLWPCDAVVLGNKTKQECEAQAIEKMAPMFYFDGGSCHVYVSYTSNGIDDLYSGLANRQNSVCLSGSAPPTFDDTATGYLYAVGKRVWDEGATHCSFCPAGLHTEVAKATQCRQCKRGTYDSNPQSDNPCQACELGRFQDEPGQATCKACSAGRYQDETGGEQCKASGQGYRAVGQGLVIAGTNTQDTALWAKTSGPMQTNTNAQAATIDFEGATGREICGRNSFAAGYENFACLQTPIGSISVSRRRTWTKEGQNCFFETETSLFYGSISASLFFYDGDLFNRNGLHNLDECIDFVNERSTERLADAVAVSFGEGHCHFYSNTAEGVAPKCILNDLYESARLSIGEAQYGSASDAPALDAEWSRKWTTHEGVRFVSPYQCTGINYEYIGDYLSVGDCINTCRHASHESSSFLKAACRYISYNSDDNKCYLVNWEKTIQPDPTTNDASGSSGKIYENSLANIDMPCSFGSRSIPHNDQDGIGSGGYRIQDYVPEADVGNFTEFEVNDDDSFGDTMKIQGQYSASQEKSLGNGGFASLRSGSEDAELPLGKTLVTHDLLEVRKITSIRLWVGHGVHKTEHGYQYGSYQTSDSNARYPARFWPKQFKINDVPYTVNLEPWDLHAAWSNANGYGDIELDLDEPLYTHQLSVEITEWGAAYVAVERYDNYMAEAPKVRSRCKADNSLFPDNGFGANPSSPPDCSHNYYHDFIFVNIADVEKVDHYYYYDPNPNYDNGNGYSNEATLKLTFQAVGASDSEWSIAECASMPQQTRSGGEWKLMTSFLATRGDGSKHLMTFDNTYSIGGTTYPESVRNMWQYTGTGSIQGCQQECLRNGHKYATYSGFTCNCANNINPYQLMLEQEESAAGFNGDPTRNGDEQLYFQNQELGFYISYPCLNPSCTLPPPVRGIYELVGSNEFQANCRWTRKRYYDRLTTAILQDHTLSSNVFPNYKEAEGYSGPNLLHVLGFYEIWDLNDVTPSLYSNHQSFLTKKENRGSGKFSFVYKRVNHIAYNHSSIMPLFDVGTNPDNFETLDATMTQYRAIEGANSFEYCSGSTMQPSAAYAPSSCDDLGYPFVFDQMESVSSSRKICVKVDSHPVVKCCMGDDCDQQSHPLCDNTAVSFLSAVPYAQSQYLAIDANNEDVLLEHTNTDETAGLAHIKDKCSEMGDICIGVRSAVSSELYYAHGDKALLKIKASNDKPFFLKTANFLEHGLGSIEGSETEDGIDNIQDCYARCIQIRFCLMFSFETSSQTCRLQRDLSSSVASSSTSVVFLLHKNTEDNSKAQFCFPCAIGRKASDANQGGTGNCQKCAPGKISSTDDLYVAEEHVGLTGQEQCQACPSGMMFLAATGSCVACHKGFACPKEASFLKVGVEQCRRNEYSTTSLLDFSGEDISSTASLRCTYCSGGKYSNMRGSEYCEKCPKGFYSEKLSSCLPCEIGTYGLIAGSEECISVDAQSYVAWPAATLSDKRLCSTDKKKQDGTDCTGTRICTGTHDAFCQLCPEIKPGHRTYSDGTNCFVDPCAAGTYSENGCLGENCCISCVSTCKAGQHSVGCGGPDDDGGSTENTKCQDCPVDTYTQYDAIGAPCDEANFAHPLLCAKCAEAPHVFADSNQPFTTRSPFTHLGVTHPQTHISHKRCAAGSNNTGSPENSFPESERAARCCSAAAYECIPCRNSEKVTYRYSYNIRGRTERWGRSNQPAWSTNEETGATHCKSYWNVWNYDTRAAIVKFDEDNAPPKKCTSGCGGS